MKARNEQYHDSEEETYLFGNFCFRSGRERKIVVNILPNILGGENVPRFPQPTEKCPRNQPWEKTAVSNPGIPSLRRPRNIECTVGDTRRIQEIPGRLDNFSFWGAEAKQNGKSTPDIVFLCV